MTATLTEQTLDVVPFEITPVCIHRINSPKTFYNLSSAFIGKYIPRSEPLVQRTMKRQHSFEEGTPKKLTKREKMKLRKQRNTLLKQNTRQTKEPDINEKTMINDTKELSPTVSIKSSDDNCYIVGETRIGSYNYRPTDELWQTEKCKLLLDCTPTFILCFHGHGLSLQKPITKDIIGDGNCFFRAISYVITGSQRYHGKIRTFVVQHMAANQEKFTNILRVSGQSVEDYIQVSQMAELGKYATEVEIIVTAHLLQTDIYTYMVDERWLKYSCNFVDTTIPSQNRSIYLKHCNANHYELVTNIEIEHSQLSDYFENQKKMQKVHGQKQKLMQDIECKKLIKPGKKQFKKEQDRIRKRSARKNRSELTQEMDKKTNKTRMNTIRQGRSELTREKGKQDQNGVYQKEQVQINPTN